MSKWLTLASFCLVNMANAMGFGILSDNHGEFAKFYNMPQDSFYSLFYIGLIVEMLLCLPAIRVIEWRLDYSVQAAAYLSLCGYCINLFSYDNIVTAYTSQILGSVAQLFLLPTSLYLAQTWFLLEQRSLVISLGFYSNIFGFGIGGILISLIGNSIEGVETVLIIVSSVALISLIFSLIFMRNQPKVRIEKKKKVQWTHFKDLWRQKYVAYNLVTSSAFLGMAWSFQSEYQILEELFLDHYKVATLMFVWILSGGGLGILMAWGVQIWVKRTGDSKYYDWACKVTLGIGFIGFVVAGILIQYKIDNFGLFIFIIFLIGVGSIGFYGLNFLSLIQSLYPAPVLLIGTVVAAFASLYSTLALSINHMFPAINPYFSIAIVLFLPLLYISMTYKTNFKRYKYYLNDKQTQFELLKIEQQSTVKDQ